MPRKQKKSVHPTINLNLIKVDTHPLTQNINRVNLTRFLNAFLPSRHIDIASPPPEREDRWEYPGKRQRRQCLEQAVQLYDDKKELIRDAERLWGGMAPR